MAAPPARSILQNLPCGPSMTDCPEPPETCRKPVDITKTYNPSLTDHTVVDRGLAGLTYDGTPGKEGSRGSKYVARVAAPGDER